MARLSGSNALGGGGGGVQSVNGDTGPNVVLDAADVGADPAGAAAAAVTAHETSVPPVHTVSQVTDALSKTGDTMSGDLAMGGNDVTGVGNVAAATHSGVALESGGPATDYLDRTGAYSAPASGGGALPEIQEDRTPTNVAGLALVTVFEETFTVEVGDYELSVEWQANPTVAAGNAGILVSLDVGAGYVQVEARTSHDAGTTGSAATTSWDQFADVSFASAGNVDIRVEAQEYSFGTWSNDRCRVKLQKVS